MLNRKGYTITEVLLVFMFVVGAVGSIVLFISIIHFLWS